MVKIVNKIEPRPMGQVARVLCVLQKPYDLINATEFLQRHCPEAEIHAAVIGTHANALSVMELCRQRNIGFTRVADPDLYANWVAYLNSKENLPRPILLSIKALILPLAYIYWFYAFLSLAMKVGGERYDLVVLDAWRSKCFYVSAILKGLKETPLALTDGGFSTLHYGLCAAFERGGAKELVRTALRQQRPVMPAILRRMAAAQFSERTPFFTCYRAEIGSDCAFPVLENSYLHCKAVLGAKRVRPDVMIMGIPRLKHIDTYVRHALDAQAASGLARDVTAIEYRFHPTDRNRGRLDSRYKRMIEQGVTGRGMKATYPRYSLEADFLEQPDIPAIIVSYPSSSVRWIEEVLGSNVRLVPVADR